MLPESLSVRAMGISSRKPTTQESGRRNWIALQADSNRPEVQEMIRREIRRGAIRVSPLPGDSNRVLIVRADVPQAR
jgi:hypothetical protein